MALLLARFAIRCLSTERLTKWASQPPKRINRFAADDVGWVRWAVDDIGSRKWMSAACLPRALAAQGMLRSRGISSTLCLGVARTEGGLAAHAWIELAKEIIVGADGADGYARLIEFGGARE